jgi:D-glycerate 3-kinase
MLLSMQGSLWPTEPPVMSAEEYGEMAARIHPAFVKKLREARMDAGLAESLKRVYLPLAAWVRLQKQADRPFVLGVNGAQGSGKSTLSQFLRLILSEGYGYRVAGFSIDDIYKTHAERERLGREVHPLLVTRGVPGTHDVQLALQTLRALTDPAGGRVAIPAFDKAHDDRLPESQWPTVEGPVDVVIFEGWCVGANPQPEDELAQPLNELESREDVDGRWRSYVNKELKGEYAELFGRLDRLVMLKVPNMKCVYEWRSLQEEKLAAATAPAGRRRIMDSSGLKRFIMHYERLTRHMLNEMPDRADLTLFLDEHHQFTAIHINH